METLPDNILKNIKLFTETNLKSTDANAFLITNDSQTIANIENQIEQFRQDRTDNQCLNRISLSVLQYKQCTYEQIYRIVIKGRQNTHYQFRKIVCYIFFPNGYPIKPPVIYFNDLYTKAKKYENFKHINVFLNGRLCQEIIQSLYKPNVSLSEILEALENTLYNENPNSAANGDLKTLKATKLQQYHKKMREQSQLLQLVSDDEDDQ